MFWDQEVEHQELKLKARDVTAKVVTELLDSQVVR